MQIFISLVVFGSIIAFFLLRERKWVNKLMIPREELKPELVKVAEMAQTYRRRTGSYPPHWDDFQKCKL